MGASVHELGGQNGNLAGTERFYDHQVQEPVLHRGKVCDAGLVSPLVGVPDRYEHGRCCNDGSVNVYGVLLGAEVLPELPGQHNVGDEPAAGRGGEAPGYVGIESHAGRAEERLPVHAAAIHVRDDAAVEGVDYLNGQGRDAQMQGQAVAASAGDDAQCLVGTHEPAGHFVHGAVSSHSHHDVGIGLPGQLRRMAGALRVCNRIRGLKERMKNLQPLAFSFSSRMRVNDKQHPFHAAKIRII